MPPAIFQSGKPAFLHFRSQSAVSAAASARDVIGPTVVACVLKNSSCQICSMRSESESRSCGSKVSFKRLMIDAPPVPIVYE